MVMAVRSRFFISIAAFAVIATACATDATVEGPATTAAARANSTTSPASGATDAPSVPATTAPDPNAVAAPDFTLALGDGGSFTLSQEARPVYMIFWAEW